MHCKAEKVLAYIKKIYPDYEHDMNDFGVFSKGDGSPDELRIWKLDIPQPTETELDAITDEEIIQSKKVPIEKETDPKKICQFLMSKINKLQEQIDALKV